MKVICTDCKTEFEVEALYVRRDHDIQIKYFICPHCSREYVASVTDEDLRENIRKYKRMADSIAYRTKNGKTVSEAYIAQTLKLLSENKKRGEFLTNRYINAQ